MLASPNPHPHPKPNLNPNPNPDPDPNPDPNPNPNQVASFFKHALGISEPFRYRGTTLTPTLALAPTLT